MRHINQAQTAINHFHEVVVPNLSKSQQAHILSVMARGCTYTIGELADFLGLQKSTVSARRNEMIAAGLIKHGKNRPCKISNVTCQTVVRV